MQIAKENKNMIWINVQVVEKKNSNIAGINLASENGLFWRRNY